MSERWRCFAAVPLDDGLRIALADAVAGWRSRPDLEGLRWTDADGWHVTLAFLGGVEASKVPRLVERLEGALRGRSGVTLETGGLGGFPSAGHARVAWYGVHDRSGELRSLAVGARAALGVEPGPFRAHVTLARARREPVDLRAWVEESSAPEGTLGVDHVDLMRSHLGRGPAHYEVLASVPLEVPSRV